MAKRASIYSVIVLIVVAGLFAGEYLLMSRRAQTECGFCRRHINPKAHVVAEVGGRRRNVCCAHCAVTEARQEKKPLRLIAVTDYSTGKMVSPDGAWGFDGDPFPDESRLALLGRLQPGANTTLAVVACNARLDKAEAKRLAMMAQDGLARAIRPVHTPFDGDVVFAMASGAIDLDPLCGAAPRTRALWLARLGAAAADALARAIVKGVRAASD